MKRLKKVTILLILLVIIGSFGNVFAAMSPTYTNKIRYTRGVGNTCYFVSSSASGYTSYINNAANKWVITGVGSNPIYMTAVSSDKGTHIDVYAKALASSYDNTNAYTTIWSSTSAPLYFEGKTNYFYAEIMINKNGNPNQATLIHEMGHCFGLDDNSNVNSIMHGVAKDRKVSTVQKCDNETINYLY